MKCPIIVRQSSLMIVGYFLFLGQSAKISHKFTDKEPIFADLSVSKPHFTDKASISQWFVRKFLTIIMRIYGQKPLFGAFVRKIEVETSEFLRTNGRFWPFCP